MNRDLIHLCYGAFAAAFGTACLGGDHTQAINETLAVAIIGHDQPIHKRMRMFHNSFADQKDICACASETQDLQ